MNPYKYEPDKFAHAVAGSGGVISCVARRMGVNRKTIADWRDRIPEAAAILQEEFEQTLDTAESQLFNLVRAGDVTAVKYLLSTRGKDRGYIQRHEADVRGKIENYGKVTVYLPENGRGDPWLSGEPSPEIQSVLEADKGEF